MGLGHGVHVALEIGAGQIVGQEIEGRAEEVLPFLGEVLFQGGLVAEQPVQAAIGPVLVGHARAGVEQHVHAALGEPFFVDEEFAARGEQAVDDEQFQDFVPRHVARVIGQRVAPEGVEAEVFPKLGGGPAVAEAAGRLYREGGRA